MRICLECQAKLLGSGWECPQCGFTPESREGIFYFAPELSIVSDCFPPEAHEVLACLERGCFWFSSRNRLISKAMNYFFPSASTMFEIGCGTGYVLEHLSSLHPEMQFTGGELYEAGLRVARSRVPGAELIQVDALRLPYDAEFDLVGIFDVLEHIEDDARVLGNIHKSLVPGGGLLLTVPQHAWLWSAWDEHSGHKRRYSRRELISKLHTAGFEIKWISSFLSLLLPLMLATRLRFLLPWADRTNKGQFSELRLPRKLNVLLEFICSFERGFLRPGVALPAGGP